MRNVLLMLCAGLMLPGLAQADVPKRKPGLWEMKMSSPGGRGGMPMTMQTCVGANDDTLMQQRAQGAARQNCSKNTVRREGDKVIGDSVCQHAGTTLTTHSVFSGDFSSGYRGDSTTTYSPPMRGMKEAQTTIEARWLGACKPGQKPGDVVMPGMPGGSINMNEIMKNMPRQ